MFWMQFIPFTFYNSVIFSYDSVKKYSLIKGHLGFVLLERFRRHSDGQCIRLSAEVLRKSLSSLFSFIILSVLLYFKKGAVSRCLSLIRLEIFTGTLTYSKSVPPLLFLNEPALICHTQFLHNILEEVLIA